MIPGASPNLTRSITSTTLPNTRSSNTTTRKEERGRTQRPPVQCTTTSRTDTRTPTNPGGGGRTTTPTPMWSTATCTWRTCLTDIATSHMGTIRTNTMSDLSPLSRELRVRQLEKLVRQWHGSRQSHHGWTRTLGARLRPQMLSTCVRSACTPPQPLRGPATRARPWPRRISSRKKPPARPTQ